MKIKDNLMIFNQKKKDNTYGWVEINTLDNGKMVKEMEKVRFFSVI